MYLRRFANDAKEVVLVDRDDFYGWDTGHSPEEIEDPAMLDPEHIEKLLGVFESRAAPAFDRMIESGHPPQTAKDRYHLTHYIALQAARGQRFREDLAQTATLVMRRHLRANNDPDKVRAWLAERGKPSEPEDVEAFAERVYSPNGPRLVPDQAIAIQQSLGFAIDQVATSMWMRSWLVLTFDHPCLLTSDEPVVAFHPDDEPVTAMNAPFVLFAVDRQHLLVMRQVEGDPSTEPSGEPADEDERTVSDSIGRGRPEHATHYNSLVATQAERHIVHHPDDTALLDDLVLGPRTVWGEEILETIRDSDTVTVRSRARRLPVETD